MLLIKTSFLVINPCGENSITLENQQLDVFIPDFHVERYCAKNSFILIQFSQNGLTHIQNNKKNVLNKNEPYTQNISLHLLEDFRCSFMILSEIHKNRVFHHRFRGISKPTVVFNTTVEFEPWVRTQSLCTSSKAKKRNIQLGSLIPAKQAR